MSHWDFGMPPAEHHDFRPRTGTGPWAGTGGEASRSEQHSTAPYPVPPAEDYDEFDDDLYSPISYERDPYGYESYQRDPDGYGSYERDPLEPAARRLGLEWPDGSWPPRRNRRSWRAGGSRRGDSWRDGSGRPPWLVPAAVALTVAAAVGVVLVTGGHPAGRAGGTSTAAPPQPVRPVPGTAAPGTAAPPAPLTMTEAQGVLAGYTSANNGANAQRNDALLATIETGTSYTIDAGIYRVQRAEQAPPYPAFGPARARYYIPRQQSAAYPRWFVAQVANANLASPGKVTGTEYLLFTQAAPGATWKNAIEPYLVPGATAPAIALGSDGLATAISPDTTSLAVAPARLPGLTAASLDGAGPLPDPGNLADRLDLEFWRAKLPAASVSGRHAPASGGQVFGLRTADGGALLFYTDAAELTLAPPPGNVLRLTIPGFYSSGQALSRAGIGYLEQFATYVPAHGGTGLRVIADYSGITSRN
jgi:hypothetical protein